MSSGVEGVKSNQRAYSLGNLSQKLSRKLDMDVKGCFDATSLSRRLSSFDSAHVKEMYAHIKTMPEYLKQRILNKKITDKQMVDIHDAAGNLSEKQLFDLADDLCDTLQESKQKLIKEGVSVDDPKMVEKQKDITVLKQILDSKDSSVEAKDFVMAVGFTAVERRAKVKRIGVKDFQLKLARLLAKNKQLKLDLHARLETHLFSKEASQVLLNVANRFSDKDIRALQHIKLKSLKCDKDFLQKQIYKGNFVIPKEDIQEIESEIEILEDIVALDDFSDNAKAYTFKCLYFELILGSNVEEFQDPMLDVDLSSLKTQLKQQELKETVLKDCIYDLKYPESGFRYKLKGKSLEEMQKRFSFDSKSVYALNAKGEQTAFKIEAEDVIENLIRNSCSLQKVKLREIDRKLNEDRLAEELVEALEQKRVIIDQLAPVIKEVVGGFSYNELKTLKNNLVEDLSAKDSDVVVAELLKMEDCEYLMQKVVLKLVLMHPEEDIGTISKSEFKKRTEQLREDVKALSALPAKGLAEKLQLEVRSASTFYSAKNVEGVKDFYDLSLAEIQAKIESQKVAINDCKQKIEVEKVKSNSRFLKMYKAIARFFSKEQLKEIKEKLAIKKLFKGSKVSPEGALIEMEQVVDFVVDSCGDFQDGFDVPAKDRQDALLSLEEEREVLQTTLNDLHSDNETVFERLFQLIIRKFKITT